MLRQARRSSCQCERSALAINATISAVRPGRGGGCGWPILFHTAGRLPSASRVCADRSFLARRRPPTRRAYRSTRASPGISSPPACGRPTLDEKILRGRQFGEGLTFFLPRTARGHLRFRAPTPDRGRPFTLARHDERVSDHMRPATRMDGPKSGKGRGGGSSLAPAQLAAGASADPGTSAEPRARQDPTPPSLLVYGASAEHRALQDRSFRRSLRAPVDQWATVLPQAPAAMPLGRKSNWRAVPIRGSPAAPDENHTLSSPWAGTGKQAPLNLHLPRVALQHARSPR
jgi:hypothetical protein